MGVSKSKIHQVVCPHCGVNPPGRCVKVTADGPTRKSREPHQERVELANEYFTKTNND